MTSDDGLGCFMTQKEASFDRLTKPCTGSLPTPPHPSSSGSVTVLEKLFFFGLKYELFKSTIPLPRQPLHVLEQCY